MKIVQIFIKKVLPVNSEVLVHLKNIESPGIQLPYMKIKMVPLFFSLSGQMPCENLPLGGILHH